MGQLKELQSALAKRNSKLQAARKESKRLKLIATAERSKINALVGQLKDNANMMLDIGKKKSSKSTEECLTPPSLPHIEMQKHNKLKKFDFHYKKLCASEIVKKNEAKAEKKASKENSSKAIEGLQKQHFKTIEKTNKQEVTAKAALEKKRAKELKSKGESESKVKKSKENLEKAKE